MNRNAIAARDLNKDLKSSPCAGDGVALTKAIIDTLRPIRHLSYFERETAKALGKSVDSHGNIDLSENANRATGHTLNRNFRVADMTVEQTFGVTKAQATEVSNLGQVVPAGTVSKCARYCYVPGRNCQNCLGHGYKWAQGQLVAKMRKQLNQRDAVMGSKGK